MLLLTSGLRAGSHDAAYEGAGAPFNNLRPKVNIEWSLEFSFQTVIVVQANDIGIHTQLELLGWLTVERIARFGRRNTPLHYALTMYINHKTGGLTALAFERIDPETTFLAASASHGKDTAVASQGQRRRTSGTQGGCPSGVVSISDTLK